MNKKRLGSKIEKFIILTSVFLWYVQVIFDFIIELTGEPIIYFIVMIFGMKYFIRSFHVISFCWDHPNACRGIPMFDNFVDKNAEKIERLQKWMSNE